MDGYEEARVWDEADNAFWKYDYDEAMALYQKLIDAGCENSFKNESCSIGITLLCMGRFEEAKSHFTNLIEDSNYRISSQRLYLGLAHWAEGEDEKAIRIWKDALKHQYANRSGLDVLITLSHAAACRPDLLDKSFAWERIEKYLLRHHGEASCHIAEYVIGRIPEDAIESIVKEQVASDAAEGVAALPTVAARMLQSSMAELEFARSTVALMRGDTRRFRSQLKRCAEIKNCPTVYLEVVISRVVLMTIRQRLRSYRIAAEKQQS